MNHPVVWTIVIIIVAFLVYWIINMQSDTPVVVNVKSEKKKNTIHIKQSSEIDLASPASFTYSDITDQSFSPPMVDLTPDIPHIGIVQPAVIQQASYRGPNYIPRSGRNGRNYHEIPNPKYFKPNIVTLNINKYEEAGNSQ